MADQPRDAPDLALTAGLPALNDPRVVHVNLFGGAGYPIALTHKLVSVWGGWDWLPTGLNEDQQLRAAFDAGDKSGFKKRSEELLSQSQDTGERATSGQQWTMCTMRKGDVLFVKNRHFDGRPITKYLIGVWTKDMTEQDGAIWTSLEALGLSGEDMSPKSAGCFSLQDRVSLRRLFRPVCWVREGNWKQISAKAKSKLGGPQVKTIGPLTSETMFIFDELLRKSQPFHGSPAAPPPQPPPSPAALVVPQPCPPGRGRGKRPLEGAVPLQPSFLSPSSSSMTSAGAVHQLNDDRTAIEKRLDELEQLKAKGKVSNAEYIHHRERILSDL